MSAISNIEEALKLAGQLRDGPAKIQGTELHALLTRALAALKEPHPDSVRLDWIEEDVVTRKPYLYVTELDGRRKISVCGSKAFALRDAIDAAMQKERP